MAQRSLILGFYQYSVSDEDILSAETMRELIKYIKAFNFSDEKAFEIREKAKNKYLSRPGKSEYGFYRLFKMASLIESGINSENQATFKRLKKYKHYTHCGGRYYLCKGFARPTLNYKFKFAK